MNIAKIAQLEYYKFRHYRPFLVILGLFVFCFLLLGFSVKSLLDWFTEKAADDDIVKRFIGRGIPIFDFVDIWQNLAWPATVFKWIPAFVVIISVTLEYSQKTIKQNIIDGLSKREFLLSKLALVTIISLGSALLLFLLGLFLGLLYSPVKDFASIVENLEFIQIQQDYLEAKSQFDLAKSDYDRQQQLAKENVNSQKTLQQSQSNFKTWQAKYFALREKLSVLNLDPATVENGSIRSSIDLYSPINGYVTDVNINIGKFANPTDVLFEIVDTEHLHAELIVFEKDVPRLKIGQKVRFTLANESEERHATVYLIGREIGADRTVQIHCHIDEEDTELLPGMYLTAVVETGGAMLPALPTEAVIDYQGKKYIFVETDEGVHHNESSAVKGMQYFRMNEIQSGNSELNFIAVTVPDSLRNARIVVKGAYSLLSKLKNSEEEGGHGH